MTDNPNSLGVTATLTTDSGSASYVSLAKLGTKTGADVARLGGDAPRARHTVRDQSANDSRDAVHGPESVLVSPPGSQQRRDQIEG